MLNLAPNLILNHKVDLWQFSQDTNIIDKHCAGALTKQITTRPKIIPNADMGNCKMSANTQTSCPTMSFYQLTQQQACDIISVQPANKEAISIQGFVCDKVNDRQFMSDNHKSCTFTWNLIKNSLTKLAEDFMKTYQEQRWANVLLGPITEHNPEPPMEEDHLQIRGFHLLTAQRCTSGLMLLRVTGFINKLNQHIPEWAAQRETSQKTASSTHTHSLPSQLIRDCEAGLFTEKLPFWIPTDYNYNCFVICVLMQRKNPSSFFL